MNAPHANEIVGDYLSRLESALTNVPEPRRHELVEEVRSHIAEARLQLTEETDADLMNILERLGDPTETATAEHPPIPSPPPARRGVPALEIATLVLLPLFWPVGVVLLWMSSTWTTRDKLIGTFVPPGGYLVTAVLLPFIAWSAIVPMCRTVADETGRVLSSTCPSDTAQGAINVLIAILFVLYVVGPALTAAYLAVRMQRRRDRGESLNLELMADAPQPAGR